MPLLSNQLAGAAPVSREAHSVRVYTVFAMNYMAL
jgi:hypothetical protein